MIRLYHFKKEECIELNNMLSKVKNIYIYIKSKLEKKRATKWKNDGGKESKHTINHKRAFYTVAVFLTWRSREED